MDDKQRARLGWVKLYEDVKDAGFVCRRCGIIETHSEEMASSLPGARGIWIAGSV